MRLTTHLSESSRRARGILPHDPAAYVIFGASVHALCAGDVLTAVDGIQEMPPPATDRRNLAGSDVTLRCGGVWVLLGHLQRGSLAVRSGATVAIGAPLSGNPLPIRFGATYPTRNARLRA